MTLKRYLCVGGSLDNTWLTLFNDNGGYRHVARPARRRGKRLTLAKDAPAIEDYRVLRVTDELSRAHEILAVSTMSNEQALRRWKPRGP